MHGQQNIKKKMNESSVLRKTENPYGCHTCVAVLTSCNAVQWQHGTYLQLHARGGDTFIDCSSARVNWMPSFDYKPSEIGWEAMDWIDLAQYTEKCWTFVNKVSNFMGFQ